MDEVYVFYPPRWSGGLFLTSITGLMVIANLWNLAQIAFAPASFLLVIHLALALILPIPLPWLIYRLRALRTAQYNLERDGIRLHWGMRIEEIPMDKVLWIRLAEDDTAHLIVPTLRLPGTIVGNGARRLHDGSLAEVVVEFMASQTKNLVLLATPERVFALSPSDPITFIQTFYDLTEFGSLNPIPARSVFPTYLPAGVMRSNAMRVLLAIGVTLNLALIIAVVAVTATRYNLSISFSPTGVPLALMPSKALWLLPFVNTALFLIDWGIGFFFFRTEKNRSIAFMLWGNSVFATILFLGALYYILQTAT